MVVLAPDANAGIDRADAARTGVYGAETPELAGTVLFQAAIDDDASTHSAYANGQLYVGSTSGLLWRIDVETGTATIFNRRLSGLQLSGVTVADGKLLVGASDGSLHAFTLDGPDDNNYAWWNLIGGAVSGSPLVVNGIAFAGGSTGFFKAIDVETGDERWSAPIGAAVVGSAAYADGVIVVADASGALHAITEGDGDVTPTAAANVKSLTWSVALGDGLAANPVISDGAVITLTRSGAMQMFQLSNGSPITEATDGRVVIGAPAVAGGIVVASRANASVDGSRATTGEALWSAELDANVTSGPIVVGQSVLVGTNEGTVAVIDLGTGQLSQTLSVGAPILSLSFADGNLFAVCAGGVVIAIA